jgi:branched-chain amino acid transport system substrate-binding protein
LLGSSVELDGAWRRAVEHDLVTVSESASSGLITDLDDDNLIFRITPPDQEQAQVAARELFGHEKRRVALLRRDDSYAEGLAEQFAAEFELLGGTVSADVSYDISGEDIEDLDVHSYDEELDAVFASEPEVIFLIAFDEGAQITQRITQRGDLSTDAGRDVEFFGSDSLYDLSILEASSAEVLERLSGTAAGVDEASADFQNFAGRLSDAGLGKPWNSAPQLYDAVYLIALAMQAAQSAESANFKLEMAPVSRADGNDTIVYPHDFRRAKTALLNDMDVNYEGVSGPIELNAAGDPSEGTILIWVPAEDEDGALSLVTLRTAEF